MSVAGVRVVEFGTNPALTGSVMRQQHWSAHRALNASDLTQCSKTTGDRLRDMSSLGDVWIQINTQIANTANGLDCVGLSKAAHLGVDLGDGQTHTKELRSWRHLILKTVRPHPCGHIVNTLSFSFLESQGRNRMSETCIGEQKPYVWVSSAYRWDCRSLSNTSLIRSAMSSRKRKKVLAAKIITPPEIELLPHNSFGNDMEQIAEEVDSLTEYVIISLSSFIFRLLLNTMLRLRMRNHCVAVTGK